MENLTSPLGTIIMELDHFLIANCGGLVMEDSLFNIGELFQEKTKYFRSVHKTPLPLGKKTPPHDLTITTFSLPKPFFDQAVDFGEILQRRRSIRDYQQTPLSLKELANLLWATQGLTGRRPSPWYRTVPSAGALHPIDTYIIVHRVEELPAGIYFFRVAEFSLQEIKRGDFSSQITRAALGQEMVMNAAVVFIWVAVIARSRQKYRQRAYRYIYLDCGHIGQNLYLAATAMNLGCCSIGAFFDDEVNTLLDIDGQEETTIYLASVGKI